MPRYSKATFPGTRGRTSNSPCSPSATVSPVSGSASFTSNHWSTSTPDAPAGRVASGGVMKTFEISVCPKPSTNSRSEEHTSELQSLMRNSYAVFCLKRKTHNHQTMQINICTENQHETKSYIR